MAGQFEADIRLPVFPTYYLEFIVRSSLPGNFSKSPLHENMPKRRQPSGEFFRRLKAYSKPKPNTDIVATHVSWIRRFRNSDGWLWAEAFTLLAVLATVWQIRVDLADRELQREALRIDLEDRQTQRIAQAWELVTRPAPGNAGKGPALEYLNEQGIALIGIDLSNENNGGAAFLQEVNLQGANLIDANLEGAYLYGANLVGAGLVRTNLVGADLTDANLENAHLIEANLSGAKIGGASFEGANLQRANLDYALMPALGWGTATGITQAQLDVACGDSFTVLPPGLSIKRCDTSEDAE